MADKIVGQEYPAKGTTYVIPKLENVADAVVAFTEYSDSIPFSEYIVTETVTADTGVDNSYNGKMIVAQADVTLTFGNLENGFSVACVADGEYTISYEGVDKENQQTQAYEVATVVTVNDRNILSVARAESDSIIIDEGPPKGSPPQPNILNPEGGTVIYFESSGDGSAGPTEYYGAEISPNNQGEGVIVDQDNLEVEVVNFKDSVTYTVSVYGVNSAGRGASATTQGFQLNFNNVIGSADTEIIADYKNTGLTYQVMRWNSAGTYTMTVESATKQFNLLIVGGGGSGSGSSNPWHGNGGDGGFAEEKSIFLEKGDYEITIGTGGGGNGRETIVESIKTLAGGNKGINIYDQGPPNGMYQGKNGKSNGFQSTIWDGVTATWYGKGGVGGHNAFHGGIAGVNGGGGSGGEAVNNTTPGKGGDGVVIIAWEVKESTTRQIEQAQAEKAARQAGVEEGLEQGIQEGYSQAQEDLQEELTYLRTQLSSVGTTDV